MEIFTTIICFSTLFTSTSGGISLEERINALQKTASNVISESLSELDYDEGEYEILKSDESLKQIMDFTLYSYGLLSENAYQSIQGQLQNCGDMESTTYNGNLSYDFLLKTVNNEKLDLIQLMLEENGLTILSDKTIVVSNDDGKEEEFDSQAYTTAYENEEDYPDEAAVEEIPLIKHDDSKMAVSVNSADFTDKPFVGIYANKDACITVYNKISEFIGKKVALGAAGFSTGLVIEALSMAFPEAVAYLTSLFGAFISEFVAFLSSLGGPIVTVIAIIMAIFATMLISILVSMYYCGSQQHGFAIGWIVHSFFSWEWINEVIYD